MIVGHASFAPPHTDTDLLTRIAILEANVEILESKVKVLNAKLSLMEATKHTLAQLIKDILTVNARKAGRPGTSSRSPASHPTATQPPPTDSSRANRHDA